MFHHLVCLNYRRTERLLRLPSTVTRVLPREWCSSVVPCAGCGLWEKSAAPCTASLGCGGREVLPLWIFGTRVFLLWKENEEIRRAQRHNCQTSLLELGCCSNRPTNCCMLRGLSCSWRVHAFKHLSSINRNLFTSVSGPLCFSCRCSWQFCTWQVKGNFCLSWNQLLPSGCADWLVLLDLVLCPTSLPCPLVLVSSWSMIHVIHCLMCAECSENLQFAALLDVPQAHMACLLWILVLTLPLLCVFTNTWAEDRTGKQGAECRGHTGFRGQNRTWASKADSEESQDKQGVGTQAACNKEDAKSNSGKEGELRARQVDIDWESSRCWRIS